MTTPRITAHDLAWIAKAKQEQLQQMKAGVSLEARTGYTIDKVVARATKARIDLARDLLRAAQAAFGDDPPQFRSSISRSYYSMYHAVRATVYYSTGGDDHEKHSELPNHLPDDFPDSGTWKNNLKNARLTRNRADYDPLPRQDARFSPDATQIMSYASQLLPVVRSYLRAKGWKP